MMQDQPAIETGKDILFLLTGGWDSEDGEARLCADCCTIEGALLLNPHWAEAVTIVRVEAARPRAEIVALLDEDNQNAPTLLLAADTVAHEVIETFRERRFLTDPRLICRQLAEAYGGSRPN
jgi:hypothetical protein